MAETAQNNNGTFKKIIFENLSIDITGKKILDDVSGYACEGQMLALMGQSGCGKTSLLNYISHRRELLGVDSSGIKRKVLFDGRAMNKYDRKNIGYVMQNDIFFEKFTLRDTLNFYAKILLPEKMSLAEKKNKVVEILDMLELTHAMNTIIGGGLVRGLSGGEKKRANIAVELLTDPDVLVLDEPTSGLDSGMAMHLMKLLKKLAVEKNKTIIAAIHQPSSQVFFMFDRLLLLSHGKIAYFGEVTQVEEYFESAGFPCEKNWNIADHMIETLSNEKGGESQITDFYKSHSIDKSSDPQLKSESEVKPKIEKCSFINQIKVLSRRTLRYSAKETFNLANLIRYLLISFLVGGVFFKTGFYAQNLQNSIGLMFYTSLQNIIDPIFTNLLQFGPEFTVIRKERMSKMYKLSAYYIGKILVDSIILMMRPTLTWTIIYFLTELTPSWYFLVSLLTNFLFAALAQSISLFISSFGMPYVDSVGICSLTVTFSLLLAGFYNKALPAGVSWAMYLSPMYYAYILQFWIQLLANNGVPCSTETKNVKRDSNFVNLCRNNKNLIPSTEALSELSLPSHPEYYYLIIILALVTFYISTYFILRRTLSRIRKRKSNFGKLKTIIKLRMKKLIMVTF